jgi:hypothetical protein
MHSMLQQHLEEIAASVHNGGSAGVYMKGSMNMSYDSANLTTPDIKWLGVRPSDLNRFNIPKQCRIKMTEEDMKTGKKMVPVPHLLPLLFIIKLL